MILDIDKINKMIEIVPELVQEINHLKAENKKLKLEFEKRLQIKKAFTVDDVMTILQCSRQTAYKIMDACGKSTIHKRTMVWQEDFWNYIMSNRQMSAEEIHQQTIKYINKTMPKHNHHLARASD